MCISVSCAISFFAFGRRFTEALLRVAGFFAADFARVPAARFVVLRAPVFLAATLRFGAAFFAVVLRLVAPTAFLAAVFLAAGFLAVVFLAVPAFLAAGFLAVVFLAVPAFLTAGFLAVVFLAVPAFLVVAAFLVVVFLAVAFLAPVAFFAAGFLAAVFLAPVAFLAVDFFAPPFLAAAALRVVFFAAFFGPDAISMAVAGERLALFFAAFRFLGRFATIVVPPSSLVTQINQPVGLIRRFARDFLCHHFR